MSSDLLGALASIGIVTRPVILVLLLVGIYRASGRAGFAPSRRTGVTAAAGIVLVAWYALIWALAVHGAFLARSSGFTLAIPSAVDLPLLLSFIVLRRLDVVRRLLDATPVPWLIGIQAYRVFGGIFILETIRGRIPPEFALPAGIGDMLTGVLAALLAWRLVRRPETPASAVYAWNALGILDLVIALTLGVLTSPGRFHVLALANPNLGVGSYPNVMIPAYAVPLSLILHGLSIWQLRRRTVRARSGAAPRGAAATA
jgi:hypothetical protein